jgi:hypothetical protein
LIKPKVVVGLISRRLILSGSITGSEVELKGLLLLLGLWLLGRSKLKIKTRFQLQILSWSLPTRPEVNVLRRRFGCFLLLSRVLLVILLLLPL